MHSGQHFQVVPVYREMIQNRIELRSCQAVSQCPQAMTGNDKSGFNFDLLEKELLGYSRYEALMNFSNWVSVGGLVLAIISIMVQI